MGEGSFPREKASGEAAAGEKRWSCCRSLEQPVALPSADFHIPSPNIQERQHKVIDTRRETQPNPVAADPRPQRRRSKRREL